MKEIHRDVMRLEHATEQLVQLGVFGDELPSLEVQIAGV